MTIITLTPDTIRSILGIIGNITSFLLFASPIPTILHIFNNKSVQQFKFHPYVAGIINCAMWVYYSMPFIHPHNILVTTVNATGFFLYFIYIIVYFLYSNPKQRISMSLYLLLEIIFFVAIAYVTLVVFPSLEGRAHFVGIFCDVFGVVLYSSPMTVMWMVVRTKSVEFMPLALSLTGFVNGIVWSVYALIRFDPFIFINDGIGALLGAVQLVLYACYYEYSPPKRGKDKDVDEDDAITTTLLLA